jgi:hypothetical protein
MKKKKVKKMNRKIKLVLSIAICMLFIATAFSGAVGMVDVNKKEKFDIEMSATPLTCLQTTITLYPTDDSWVNELYPNDNYGADDNLIVMDYSSTIVRSYLRFDVSVIPVNATIFDARFSLFFWSWDDAVTSDIGVYRVYGLWNEGTITWNNQPGFASFYEDAIGLGPATNSYESWNVTALTQGWVSGIVPNFGVVVKCCLETGGNPAKMKIFRSKEWIVITERPKLTITYNTPPDKPRRPSGPTSGIAGTSYNYSSSTVDPDGDQIEYLFDWGDGNNSGWLGPYPSGARVNASYTWSRRGTYNIQVKARDYPSRAHSPWSDPLTVTMPKNKNTMLDRESVSSVAGINVPHFFWHTYRVQCAFWPIRPSIKLWSLSFSKHSISHDL